MNIADEIQGEGLEVVRVDYDHGYAEVYVKGHPLPMRGALPTLAALHTVNDMKRVLKNKFSIYDLLFYRHSLLLMTLVTSYCFTKRLVPAAQGVHNIATDMGLSPKVARALALVVEYDQAYRFRAQDLALAVGLITRQDSIRRSLWWMAHFNKKREKEPRTAQKIGKAIFLLRVLLLWPPWNKRLKNSLERNIPLLFPNDADKYWMFQKTDYDYMGLSYQDRQDFAKRMV